MGQSFSVAGVTITVKAIRGNRVRLRFDSPEGVLVSRGEVIEELNAAAEQALAETTSRPASQAEGKRDEPRGPRASRLSYDPNLR
jgi:sRNA-binding carbon storage regulator CsrA